MEMKSFIDGFRGECSLLGFDVSSFLKFYVISGNFTIGGRTHVDGKDFWPRDKVAGWEDRLRSCGGEIAGELYSMGLVSHDSKGIGVTIDSLWEHRDSEEKQVAVLLAAFLFEFIRQRDPIRLVTYRDAYGSRAVSDSLRENRKEIEDMFRALSDFADVGWHYACTDVLPSNDTVFGFVPRRCVESLWNVPLACAVEMLKTSRKYTLVRLVSENVLRETTE